MNLFVNIVILTIPWLLILTLCNSQSTKNSSEEDQSSEEYTGEDQSKENPSDGVTPSAELPFTNDEMKYGRRRWNSRRTHDPYINNTEPSGRYEGMTHDEFIVYKKRTRYERLRTMVPFPHDLSRDPFDCFLLMPKNTTTRYYYSPVVFKSDSVDGIIIHPDRHGVINVKRHTFFQLSCPGNHFKKPFYNTEISEITVKCLRKEFIKYKGIAYRFANFSCVRAPRSVMKVADVKCQGNNLLLEVGLQTMEHFIKMYKVCFDPVRQNPIYSWYVRQRPVSRHRQRMRWTPQYNSTFYNGVNVEMEFFAYENLFHIVKTTVKSTFLANQYLQLTRRRMLRQKDLTTYNDFHYLFEQLSAYYSENTVPAWLAFSQHVWKDVERSVRYDLARGINRHLVLTGTYGVSTLRDGRSVEHELYLNPPDRIPVPLYLWKLNYDLDEKEGLIYVGLNNPYVNPKLMKPICDPIPCRDSLVVRKPYDKCFLYCCTIESFESVYGKIDPIVYNNM